MISSVSGLIRSIPPALVRALVLNKLWSAEQAYNYALRDPHLAHRSEILTAIVPSLHEPLRTTAISESVAAALATSQIDVGGSRWMVPLLGRILPYVAGRLRVAIFDHLLSALRADTDRPRIAYEAQYRRDWDEHHLIGLLRWLMPSLVADEKPAVIGAVLATHSKDGSPYPEILPAIIPFSRMPGIQLKPATGPTADHATLAWRVGILRTTSELLAAFRKRSVARFFSI